MHNQFNLHMNSFPLVIRVCTRTYSVDVHTVRLPTWTQSVFFIIRFWWEYFRVQFVHRRFCRHRATVNRRRIKLVRTAEELYIYLLDNNTFPTSCAAVNNMVYTWISVTVLSKRNVTFALATIVALHRRQFNEMWLKLRFGNII